MELNKFQVLGIAVVFIVSIIAISLFDNAE